MLTWQSPEELNTILEHVCVCMLSHFSRVWLFATPWTVALQAPLSMGFSSQECWSGLPCPSLPGASLRNSAHGKGNEEGGFSIRKGEIKPLGNPLFPSIYPQNQGLPPLLFYALTYTSDFTRGWPPLPLSENELTYSSKSIKIPGRDKSVSNYELLWRLSSPPVQVCPATCDCLQPPNRERHEMF